MFKFFIPVIWLCLSILSSWLCFQTNDQQIIIGLLIGAFLTLVIGVIETIRMIFY